MPIRPRKRQAPKPIGIFGQLKPGAVLRALLSRRGAIVTALDHDWRDAIRIIRDTRRHVPVLMSDAAALHIQICVRATRNLPGAMAEAGVLMGGSARLVCEAKGHVPFHLFDVFETMQHDIDIHPPTGSAVRDHFGTVHGRLDQVERLLAPYLDVHFHPGLFPQSIPPELQGTRFSFVHLDMDLPQSTRDALAFFHPRLVPGGILIGDDYDDPGVRRIFATYFESTADTIIPLPWGQVMIVKQG